jgi:hypothetical protein
MRAADAMASALAAYGAPLLVLLTTGSTGLTGLAFAVQWAPRLAAFGFAGALADRFGPSPVFRTANMVRAMFVSLVAAVLLSAEGETAALVVVMVFGAVSGLLAEVSFVAAETVGSNAARRSEGRAHQVQAALTGIDQGAALVGPLLGGVALLVGPTLFLLGLAALALVAACITRIESMSARTAPTPASLLSGWRTLRGVPALVWLVGGLAVSNLVIGLVEAGVPVMVIGHFKHSSTQVTLLWSGAAVATLAAVWCAQRAVSRWGVWPVGAVSAALCTAACFAAGIASSFFTYAAAVAVLMAADGGQTVILRTLRACLIPPTGFASTLSVTIVLLLFPFPLAGLAVGAIPPEYLGRLLAGCALLQGAVLTCAFSYLRRHLPTDRVPAATPSPVN